MLLDLKMSKATATKWKKGGNPTRSSVLRIAEYLGVTKERLLTGEVYDGAGSPTNTIPGPPPPTYTSPPAPNQGSDLLTLAFSQQETIRELVVSNRELSGAIKALTEKKSL
jgi:transcriptional regulator with XRE-family HTH domain